MDSFSSLSGIECHNIHVSSSLKRAQRGVRKASPEKYIARAVCTLYLNIATRMHAIGIPHIKKI